MPDIRIIHAACPDEVEAVRCLFLEYAESLGWDLTGGGHLADEVAALPGTYGPPMGALLLAYVDGAPAGVLGLQPVPESVRIGGVDAECAGELKRLYVRPAFRRHHVGRLLMQRAEAEARERGYKALVLTTSAELFPLAQSLYDSLGYGPTKPYRNDMPWPAIRWMRLDL